jgi:hypothetical protein
VEEIAPGEHVQIFCPIFVKNTSNESDSTGQMLDMQGVIVCPRLISIVGDVPKPIFKEAPLQTIAAKLFFHAVEKGLKLIPSLPIGFSSRHKDTTINES